MRVVAGHIAGRSMRITYPNGGGTGIPRACNRQPRASRPPAQGATGVRRSTRLDGVDHVLITCRHSSALEARMRLASRDAIRHR
ncbi:hypothetical protein BRPE64_DCDS06620 (plasmid) [Caballeronia insecticola]|uniref:Uncharacterized protein n=1 Tax=Caballeronia insecticola TaxID=758793 RepID=R4WSH5_9BURK|nr:hypothetical protein BRPE64_DCDS06620 [Caballeronia insecticola]